MELWHLVTCLTIYSVGLSPPSPPTIKRPQSFHNNNALSVEFKGPRLDNPCGALLDFVFLPLPTIAVVRVEGIQQELHVSSSA
jgi:hypothetical protein